MLDKRILMAFMLLAMNFGFYSRAESKLYYAAYHYNVADGLPSNEVQMLHQDDKGFIWCATNNGISRYDGYEFVNFRSNYDRQEYLSSNTILDMQEKDDKIWLVTPNGVDVFDKNTVAVTHLCPEKEVMRNIKCILPLEGGKALLGGPKGILLYDSCGYLKELFTDEIQMVRELFLDSMGNIWVGTWKRGVFLIENNGNVCRKIVQGYVRENTSVNKFSEDEFGNIFMATWGDGLICLRNAGSSRVTSIDYTVPRTSYNHYDWNIVYDICFDSNGYLWLGSPGGLRILSFNGTEFNEIPYVTESFRKNSDKHEIWCVLKSYDGTMWLSDYGGGIFSMRQIRKNIKEYSFSGMNLPSRSVTAIHQLRDNIYLLGIKGTGVVAFDFDSGKIVDSEVLSAIDKESNAVVSFVEVPDSDAVFLATRYFGVYQINVNNGYPVSLKHYDVSLSHRRSNFSNVATSDKYGNVWVGTPSGISIISRDVSGAYELITPEDINLGIAYACVYALCSDKDGKVWIGTSESGVYWVDRNSEETRIMSFCNANGLLSNDNVTTIFQDSKGRIWLGTHGGGLFLYDEEKVRFDLVDDMFLFPSDVIASITEDSSGLLWISTANGFFSYNPDNENNSIYSYGVPNELRNLSFIRNSVWTDGEQIMFGGYDGVSRFTATELLDGSSYAVLPPNIVDVQIFNKSVFPQVDNPGKDGIKLPYAHKVRLGYKDKSISIKFSTPAYSGDDVFVRYRYRLEGLEDEWNYTEANQRTVTYNNLKPGEYRFVVASTLDGNNWTSSLSDLLITALPAPWLTIWAKLIYIIAAVLSVVLINVMLRSRMKLKDALRLEQLERVKSDEVNDAKLKFFTNVSHELFNPITIISCSLDKLFQDKGVEDSSYVIIKSNLNRLLRLLQQILEFRKAESANLKLKVSEIDVVAFVRKMCDENFVPMVTDKNVKLIFSAEEENIIGFADPDKLDKILYNLLSNAYKYNRRDGRVFVNIGITTIHGHRAFRLSVKDTGYGISEENQKYLFTRFYDGDYRRFNTKGTGIGLSLTKELVVLHNGTIDVTSSEGTGSTFSVVLPIDKDAYSECQLEVSDMSETICDDEISISNQYGDEEEKMNFTLLLVEDNEELLSVLENLLETKYTILTAGDGEDALRILTTENVDLVITDYMMPCMDGIELCKKIRSSFELSHLSIIMLTAQSSRNIKQLSFEAGIDAYISKPFDVKLLVAQVNSMIENRVKLYDRFRTGHNLEPDLQISTNIDKQFVDKAVRIVEAHISEPDFGLEAFNQYMNMSNSTLYRKIKGVTGMPPKEFIRNIRFKFASRLLLEKTTNVADVAFMVGFTDPKYFSQCFKREFGVTPSQYVKTNKA